MTNKEYENKKRKCWEEFCESDTLYDVVPAFNFAFDRAYALGKQTETITPEELAQKASKWSDKILMKSAMLGPMALSARDIAYRSYIAGVSDSFGKQEKDSDAVIQGWVCRDNNSLNAHVLIGDKPKRNGFNYWENKSADYITLPKDIFPDLTWDDEPQECEIIIKRKKK